MLAPYCYTKDMNPREITVNTLEELYAKVILPQFGLEPSDVTWLDHKLIDPDNEAHIFTQGGQQYILLFEDYPGFSMAEVSQGVSPDSPPELEPLSRSSTVTENEHDADYILRFGPKTVPSYYVHNVTGYFKLYRVVSESSTTELAVARTRLQ